MESSSADTRAEQGGKDDGASPTPSHSSTATEATLSNAVPDSDTCKTPMDSDRDELTPKASNRILRNVVANWVGHFVAIISGFILPRLINNNLGDVRLGLWDFGWSIVAYMSLLTAGITSSTNRYTARYRATNDWENLNRVVGACLLIFLITATMATMLTLGLVAIMHTLLSESLQVHLNEARVLLLLLGLTAAVQMPFSVPGGVITGSQRYDLVNLVEGSSHFVTIVGIAVALLSGAGLWVLGAIVLASETLSGVAKCFIARRVCPQLVLSPRRATWSAVKEVTVFGWKLFLERVSRIVLYQTNSLLIMFYLGPASLAVYSRSTALVLHAHKLLFHFGRVFTPVASGMQARGDERELADLFRTSGQRALLVSLPIVIVLVLIGDTVLEVWMGPGFAAMWVLPILAIGHLCAMMHTPAYCILLGVNHHGLVGVASLVLALVGVGVSAVLIVICDFGILGAAIGVAVSMTLLNLFVVPVIAVRYVNMSLWQYVRDTVSVPVLACLPLVGALLLIRWFVDATAPVMLLTAVAVGAPALLLPYYFVVPRSLRNRLLAPFKNVWNRCIGRSKDGRE